MYSSTKDSRYYYKLNIWFDSAKWDYQYVNSQNIFGYLIDGLLHHVVVQEDVLGLHEDVVRSYKNRNGILHENLTNNIYHTSMDHVSLGLLIWNNMWGAIMLPPLIYVNLRGQSEEDIINLIHQYVHTELWKEKTFSVG